MTECNDHVTPEGEGHALRLSNAELELLIEEATVDAYGESEQMTGFYTSLMTILPCPSRPG
jgi:hypothetical protein